MRFTSRLADDLEKDLYITAVKRARARHRPITLRDLLDRSPRTRAASSLNTVLMPGAGSGILKAWKPAGAQTAACAQPRTCTT